MFRSYLQTVATKAVQQNHQIEHCLNEPMKCTCREVLDMCQIRTHECDMGVDDLSNVVQYAQRENILAKFDHPLLNTLQTEEQQGGHVHDICERPLI